VFNPGFSGGTTEGAWRRIRETWPDRVEELGSRPFAFRVGGERVDARVLRYRLLQGGAWEDVAWPKVLIADASVAPLQEAFAPWLTMVLREPAPDRHFAFEMPVEALDGGPAELRVEVAWDPATGALHAWWLSASNGDDPRLGG
jgi:hypothetical protein